MSGPGFARGRAGVGTKDHKDIAAALAIEAIGDFASVGRDKGCAGQQLLPGIGCIDAGNCRRSLSRDRLGPGGLNLVLFESRPV